MKLVNENLCSFELFFTLMSIKLIFSVVSHRFFFVGVFATLGDMRVHFMVDWWNLCVCWFLFFSRDGLR